MRSLFHFLGAGAIALALTAVATPDAEASVISDMVQGTLEVPKGNKLLPFDEEKAKLGEKKLFAIYFSAEWCPPCRSFTPKLVSFYDRVKSKHPELEVIFVSSDKTPEAMLKYMKTYRMKFPAVAFDKRSALKSKYAGRSIPKLVLVDETGAILSDSHEGEKYVGPNKVLKDLENRLKEKAS